MGEFYNKHYITIDDQGRVTDGWSDGPHPDRDTTDAICINEQGGYQFRLYPGGEENPPLHTMDGIPLYKWDGEKVVARTKDEIEMDSIPPLPQLQPQKLAELSAACNAAILAGCDVTLSNGVSGHISLTAEDQINLTNACASAEAGAKYYPYHLDGQLCALYSAADIAAMAQPTNCITPPTTTTWRHGCGGLRQRRRCRPLLMDWSFRMI